ncbi:hypothetical protein [Desulfotruncus alcoholivorax]|uniref:hypothetical protein n=1 Tax=Desulfotruncus alcoholivorax TaxID=265477 RepID=UPI000416148D|nr:hypothetical protein [Desulfotruncus alcoholivorax]
MKSIIFKAGQPKPPFLREWLERYLEAELLFAKKRPSKFEMPGSVNRSIRTVAEAERVASHNQLVEEQSYPKTGVTANNERAQEGPFVVLSASTKQLINLCKYLQRLSFK